MISPARHFIQRISKAEVAVKAMFSDARMGRTIEARDALPLVETGFENRGVRIAGGLRGKVLDDAWRYDIAGVYSMMRAKTIYPSQPDYDRVNRSLNVVNVNGTPTCASVVSGADRACVPFNAFIPGNSNLALNDYLFTSTDGSQNSTSLMWQALAVLNGDLGKYGITSPLAEQGVAVTAWCEANGVDYYASDRETFSLEAAATGALRRGLRAVVVSTMQAVSGAGYPGVPSLDILGNVVPFIGGEEDKLETETQKILGADGGRQPHPAVVSAHTNRVPVIDGHTMTVSVQLASRPSVDDVNAALAAFRGRPQELGLPTAPQPPIVVKREDNRPQPRLDRDAENGMATVVGRIAKDTIFDFKFTLISHNTIRGAAGAAGCRSNRGPAQATAVRILRPWPARQRHTLPPATQTPP